MCEQSERCLPESSAISDVGHRRRPGRRESYCDHRRYGRATIPIGASISCSGICLTVVAREDQDGECVAGGRRRPRDDRATTAWQWDIGTSLNLERSLKIGDEMCGHLVTGHIDGVATIVGREDLRKWRASPSTPPQLARFIAAKGSVALDGTSLTVNKVEDGNLSSACSSRTRSR